MRQVSLMRIDAMTAAQNCARSDAPALPKLLRQAKYRPRAMMAESRASTDSFAVARRKNAGKLIMRTVDWESQLSGSSSFAKYSQNKVATSKNRLRKPAPHSGQNLSRQKARRPAIKATAYKIATARPSVSPNSTRRWEAWSRAPRDIARPLSLRVTLTSSMSKIGINSTRQGTSSTDPKLERCEAVITEAQA